MAGENRHLEDLISEWSPRLQRAFLDAIAKIRDGVEIVRVVERLERGDINGALDIVNLDPVAFRALDVGIAQAYEDGGDFTMGRIPALRQPDGSRLNILFDVRNPRAEQWLRERSSTLVTAIVDDQRVMLRQHLVAGMEVGKNPTEVARDIVGRVNRTTRQREGGVLGLTSGQEEWSRSFANRLASGNPEELKAALGMSLRDKRFDRTIMKAIESGKPIPTDLRANMVAAYRARALKYRGDLIGRTEAMRSLHASQEESFRQAIDAGQVNEADVRKIWRSAQDFRVRDTHRALHGQKVGFRASFISPSGAMLRYPGDELAPVSETAMCRCTMEIRADHIGALKRKLAA
jgi:hypothetical protein